MPSGVQSSEEKRVDLAVLRRHQRHCAGREQGRLAPLDEAVDGEGQHGGQQENEPDHGPHLEVLLAHHLLVDVRRQHVVVPAHHLGHAEVGDDQREDDEGGADQPIAHPRQGDGHEGAATVRP